MFAICLKVSHHHCEIHKTFPHKYHTEVKEGNSLSQTVHQSDTAAVFRGTKYSAYILSNQLNESARLSIQFNLLAQHELY